MTRRSVVWLAAVGAALVLIVVLVVSRDLSGPSSVEIATPDLTGLGPERSSGNLSGLSAAETTTPEPTSLPTQAPTPMPTPTRVVREWGWAQPGFGGGDAITLTHGIEHYVYYRWGPFCDAPARHQIPMIWGRRDFTETRWMANLFDGPCNDGRPLLFLNEPAKVEQANIPPLEAARMFYTITRSADWPYERWHGPIYAGNNVVEERHWDAEFVQEFAKLSGGDTAIPEITGWGIHLYGNYQYGPQRGDPNVVWTGDVPPAQIRPTVYRSMRQVDSYITERRAEGNATALVVTEFGLLQASRWHTPRTYYYDTTTAFMEEYVRVFDRRPEVQAWFWFISVGGPDEFLDTNVMVDARGALTPNGVKWRELAVGRQ